MPAPVFIMRGISGSGKSHTARLIKDAWDSTISLFADSQIADTCHCVIVSADDYFLSPDGGYKFDASKLKNAHQLCRSRFLKALENEHCAVIVDNTHTRRWEYNDYVVEAMKAGRPTEIIRMATTPTVAAARNTHGLTFEMVQKQFDRFEDDDNEFIVTGENE